MYHHSQWHIEKIYFDNESLKNVWDNINGFSNRVKIRLRWYNNLNNTEVYLEEKKNKIHEEQNLPKQELVSRLENFQTKHSKKN